MNDRDRTDREPRPYGMWIAVVTEYPLVDGTLDPDLGVRAVTVDVVAFPANGARDTTRARHWRDDNTYVDIARDVYRCCELRLAKVL